MPETADELFMRRALELAKKAWGRTHPNPMVGAVIVEGGRIVAEGYHTKAGAAHAEVVALQNLGRKPLADATLYVTLEPCSTHGLTGPCVDAILEAGIGRVVVGTSDPNPSHKGSGLELLRAKGVGVIEGILSDECTKLNFIFNHWIVRRQPLLALKIASTLDGKLNLPPGQGKKINCPEAFLYVHQLRRLFPAIAVSAKTALEDNPQLTARNPGGEICPLRFVLDRHFKTAGKLGLNVFRDVYRSQTVVVGLRAHAKKADRAWYEAEGVQIWELEGGEDGFIQVWASRCAREGIVGVLIEGGPRLASSLLNRRDVDYLYAFVAPKNGDPAAPCWHAGVSLPQRGLQTSLIGDDALFQGPVGK